MTPTPAVRLFGLISSALITLVLFQSVAVLGLPPSPPSAAAAARAVAPASTTSTTAKAAPSRADGAPPVVAKILAILKFSRPAPILSG